MNQKPENLPLAGIRVLDVSHIIAGPFCVSILADYGADVIKVEPPGTGELGRQLGMPIKSEDGRSVTTSFAVLGRSRKGLSLDLRSEGGKEVFRDLARVSDVLVENFTPGAMERLGLSYHQLKRENPSLIYAAISGYGQLTPYIGPYTRWPANNAIAQAMGGLMELTGEADGPPTMVGATVGDTVPGLWAALAIMIALHQRHFTGRGQFLDVAMYDTMAAMNFQAIANYHVTGTSPTRSREGWGITFTDKLPCKDGYIAVSMWGHVAERWVRLWNLIGREDLVGDATDDPVRPGGRGSPQVLREALETWLADVTKVEAVRTLLDLGFSVGMVQTAKDIYDCPQLDARRLFVDIEDGVGGSIRTSGMPVKLSDTQAKLPTRAPYLGEHNREVGRTVLGYTDSHLQRLAQAGAFGSP